MRYFVVVKGKIPKDIETGFDSHEKASEYIRANNIPSTYTSIIDSRQKMEMMRKSIPQFHNH